MTNRNQFDDDRLVSKDKFGTNDIHQYVCLYIKHRLGGFELGGYGKKFKYLLKNKFEDLDGSYRVFYTKGVGCEDSLPFEKSKPPAPKSGKCTNQKDVFAELTPIMLAEKNCRAKILFPYHKADNHWLVGELVLNKKGKTLSVVAIAHDPKGEGELPPMKVKELEDRLKRAFVKFNVEITSQISQYTSKRLSLDDLISSGVIVAHELLKRIVNESLTLTTAYPVGARQIRECQTRFLEEVSGDEVKTYIEKIALEEDNMEESNNLVLSIKEVRNRFNEMINSEDVKNEKIEKLLKIEKDYYKPLIRQLASRSSFEEFKDLVFIFNDLIAWALTLGDLTNKLEYFTDAAIFCQYLNTTLQKKTTSEHKNKFLERYSINPSHLWNEIQTKLVTKIGGKTELLPNMTNDVEKYRKIVKNMRKQIKGHNKLIDKRFEKLKLMKTHPQDVDEHRYSIVKPIRDLFKHIAEEMKSFLAKLYSDSEQIMATPPPCRYAIIGLGSLALQQITPYSDYEFAILCESNTPENSEILNYFKNLSHLANLKTIALGETGIPFSKFQVDLDHLIHVGINFDLGGKTPLGREDKFYSLVKTIPEMLKYVYNKDDKISHIDKNLPYILENVCYVSGDKQLVEEYQAKVSYFLSQTIRENRKNCEVRALNILNEGAVEFDYVNKQPNLEPKQKKFEGDLEKLRGKFTTNKGEYFNVKQEIYRLSERMVYNLGLYFGIEGRSCWDTIDKLKEVKIINESAHKNLQYAVSYANFLRMKTYFKNEAQSGEMSIHPKNSNTSESTMLELAETDLEENGELFNYFYRAFPLYNQLEKFCAKHDELTNSEKRCFFQDDSFFECDSTTKGLIYFRLNQTENAARHLAAALKTADHENKLKILRVICHVYYFQGNYDLALHYYKKNLSMNKVACKDVAHPDVADSLNNIGCVFDSKGEYDLALEHFKQSLEMRKTIFEGVEHPSVAISLNNIGGAYYSKGEYDLAMQNYKASLEMRIHVFKNVAHSDVAESWTSIGFVYYSKGDYDLALKHFKTSLEMQITVFKDVAHPDVAKSLSSIGMAYEKKGKYDLALRYYKDSLGMRKTVTKNVPHSSVANSLSNIGDVYKIIGENDLALQYHKESLIMRRTVFGDVPHPDVAKSLCNIGIAYESKGKFDVALQHYKDSLKMQKIVFKDVSHPEVAFSLHILARAYNSLGLKNLALQCCKESLDMQTALCEDVAHPDVANSWNSIGVAYYYKGDYDMALEHFQKSLDIRNTIFKDVAHPDVARSLCNIGNAYRSKGQYDLALQYLKECLEMQKMVFKDVAHPDVVNSLNYIGNAYRSNGNFDLALQHLNESLEMQTTIFNGDVHSDVANTLDNIGYAYYSKGDYDLARDYNQKSLDIRDVCFNNAAHPSIATTMNNMGHVYYARGVHSIALSYYNDSLNIGKKCFKDAAHPDFAVSLNNIGTTYCLRGEYDLALRFFKKSLEMRKTLFQDVAHPEIATSLNNIGVAYRSKGEYNLALQYYEKSLKMRKIVFKDAAHPDVATSLTNIGDALHSNSDYDLALKYYEESLEMFKVIFKGVEHRCVAISLNNIGMAYKSKGEYGLAVTYLKESLEMRKTIFNDIAHLDVAKSLKNIGVAYKFKGEYNEALQSFKECLDMEKVFFKDRGLDFHPDIASSLNYIGNVYKSKGEHNLANRYFKKSLDMQKCLRMVGAYDP